MIVPAPLAPKFVETRCAWCRCNPCQCPRTCRCACGSYLVELATLTETMVAHQRTAEHAAWRAKVGL